jgi:hypothetical protein
MKFIHRLQVQFNGMFDQLLERQLRLKNVLTEQEWWRIKDNIRYKWQMDSYFEELKAQEIWQARLNLVNQMDPYVDKYFSTKWIQRQVLKFSDDEWAAIREEFSDMDAIDAAAEGVDEDGNPLDQEGDDVVPFGKNKDKDKTLFGPDLDQDADDVLASTKEDDEDDLDGDDDGDIDDNKKVTKKPSFKKKSKKPPFGKKSKA